MSTFSVLPIRAFVRFQEKGPVQVQEDFEMLSSDRGLFIVADGLGGAGVGDEGARTTCEALKKFLEKEAGDLEATMPFTLRSYYSLSSNVLFNGLLFANQKMLKLNQGKSPNKKAGASVIAGFMDGYLLSLASVGVCQAWLFRNGETQEIVFPRTFQRMQNLLSKNEDWDVPMMALGMSPDLEPEITELKLESGDLVVLQTDGMKNASFLAFKAKLLEVSQQTKALDFNAEAACQLLQGLLNGLEFSENYTAQVIVF